MMMMVMMMMMMMMIMNCFWGMVDQRKAVSLTPAGTTGTTLLAGFEPAQNVSLGFVEWIFPVAITKPPRHKSYDLGQNIWNKIGKSSKIGQDKKSLISGKKSGH